MILSFLNKLTLLMMAAVISRCVFNFSWAQAISGIHIHRHIFENVFKSSLHAFLSMSHFYVLTF